MRPTRAYKNFMPVGFNFQPQNIKPLAHPIQPNYTAKNTRHPITNNNELFS